MKIIVNSTTQLKTLADLMPSIQGTFDGPVFCGKTPPTPEFIERLVLSEFWPKAVPEAMIVRHKEIAKNRARSIISIIPGGVINKKFLDFGCGTGDCVNAASSANLAIGYDITQHQEWVGDNFTTDFDKVRVNGPFDVILMYDVFDHILGNVQEALGQLRSVCSSSTVVHVRCHPWTSVHGGHVYEKLNKAYAHLFLTDAQLEKYQTTNVRKINRPLTFYNEAWKEAGFKIISNVNHKINWDGEIGQFMNNQDVTEFLDKKSPQAVFGTSEWQNNILPIEFVDFRLMING